MPTNPDREHIWAQLNDRALAPSNLDDTQLAPSAGRSKDPAWDLLIIGGGITGAGILREATRLGLRALLVEAEDFASGTSSRSSKMVHGGFRYLKNGQVRMTYISVRERERLVKEGRGLVTPLGFLMASYRGDKLPGWVFGLGLIAYDLLAGSWSHRRYDAIDMHELCPPLSLEGLGGGFRYFDAQTDDARLVLRLVQEAVSRGGTAINYTRAVSLLRTKTGQVCGAVLQDCAPGGLNRTTEVLARVVINAAGAWADDLRTQLGQRCRLRRLRGSHLIFPSHRLPLTRAVNVWHPRDQRPVFAFPWEGVTLLGTTDIDVLGPLEGDPAISPQEIEYLMEAANFAFPGQSLVEADIQATFAGVRPVIDTGCTDPSKESREHVLWQEDGLLTVAGGKLTTFRCMATDALNRVRRMLPNLAAIDTQARVLDAPPVEISSPAELSPATRMRLAGRHGANLSEILATAAVDELSPIDGSPALWAELRWAARSEAVIHLSDLLLRRVRLGLLLPRGGQDLLSRVRNIAQPELGWDDARWEEEQQNYVKLWQSCYYLPG